VPYYVLMCDIKDSTLMSADARNICQIRLKEAKNLINSLLFDDDLKLVFNSGDSVQGFSRDAQVVFKAGVLLQHLMHPNKMHIGIGSGDLHVIDQTEGSNACDGPAYHEALKSIETSKYQSLDFVVRFPDDADGLINSLLHAIQLVKSDKTEKQNTFAAISCLLDVSNYNEQVCGFIAKYYASNQNADDFVLMAQSTRNTAEILGMLEATSKQNIRNILNKSKAREINYFYLSCLKYLRQSYKWGIG